MNAAMLALVVLQPSGVARDVRQDIYPAPKIDKSVNRVLEMEDGARIEILGAGKATSKGEVTCWTFDGRPDPAMAARFKKVLEQRNRFRFVPAGDGHRFVIYTVKGKKREGSNWGGSAGGEFAGFFSEGGVNYQSRLLLNAGKAKTMSILYDVSYNVPPVLVDPKVGSTARIGKGTITIAKLNAEEKRTVIYPKFSGEAYSSIMYTPMGKDGRALRLPEPKLQGSTNKMRTLRLMGAQPDNVVAIGMNTLKKDGNAIVMMPISKIGKLAVNAPYVRRFEIGGVPANPR